MFKQTIIFAAVAGLVFALAPAAQAGLVSHWTFDSNFDDSAGSNHGAAEGDAAVSAADKMIGTGSVLLDGTGDWVGINGSNSTGHELNITSAVTISAWFNGVSSPAGSQNYIYSRGDHNHGHGLLYEGGRVWDQHNGGTNTCCGGIAVDIWHHVAKTYDSTGGLHTIYIDGKAGTHANATRNDPDPGAVSTASITRIGAEGYGGGRWDFDGNIDDVGVWNSNEGADTIALINGLGRTGAIGLDQIDEAQALWAGSLGDTATIGGAPWQKVSGLSGSLGDWGGSVAGVDAYIVLDNSGNGVKVIPEPATMVLLGLGGIGLLLRRRRRS